MTNAKEIESLVMQTFLRVSREAGALEVDALSPSANVAELGVDSIVLMEAIGEIESELKVCVERDRLFGAKTIRDISTVVAQLVAEAA